MQNILEKIYKSGLRLLDPLSPDETYRVIVEEAIKLVDGDAGRLLLRKDGEFEEVYSSSFGASAAGKVRKNGFVYRAFKEKRAFYIHTHNYPDVHPEVQKLGFKSALFIPLSYKRGAIGVLVAQSYQPDHFSNKQLGILKLFGSFASLGIRKTHLYAETKKALQMRDHFISMAAHELRTPLTAVNGYTQLLKNKTSGKNSVEARWIEHLYREAIRLSNLINELLEIDRIKSGELNYYWKECSLKEITQRVINNFKFSYPDREIFFEDNLKGEPDSVVGDYDKILQVLSNLVDNAVKFSPEDKPIIFSLISKEDNLVIKIKDQGIGISKDDIPRIFEGYFRGVNNINKEGMGLGLYIVKDIVSRHHGEITVKSKPNKGTTMEITLPRANL